MKYEGLREKSKSIKGFDNKENGELCGVGRIPHRLKIVK